MKLGKIGIFLGLAGLVGAVALKAWGIIGEPSLCLLIGVFLIVGIAAAFGNRLSSVSLRDLSVTLAEAKQVRDDVGVKQQEIRELTAAVAEMAAHLGAFGNRLDGISAGPRWLRARANHLLTGLHVSEEAREKILRFSKMADAVDEASRKGEKAAAEKMWEKIAKEMEAESEKLEKESHQDAFQLKAQLSALEAAFAQKKDYVFDRVEGVYWLRTSPSSQDGPFCPACLDGKNRPVHLMSGSVRGSEWTYDCLVCGAGFGFRKPKRG